MSLPDAVLAAMRQTNQLFATEVAGKRNIAALDRVYTAHARILPPGAPMVEGREQIKGFWAAAIESLNVSKVTLETVSAEAAGDSVVEIGRAELTVGNGAVAQVKYVVHWKQEDGGWRWAVDIWNMNQ
jgi:ketosteroid isomerase-like protein